MKPAFRLAALLSLAFFTASVVAAEPPHFNRTAWQSDYAFLKVQLEQQYSHLAWFGSPQGGLDLPQLDRQTQLALGQAGTDATAAAALRTFIEAFRDGHLRALGPEVAPTSVIADPPAAEIAQLDAASACAAIGVQPTARVPFALPFDTLKGFALDNDGVAEAFRAGLLTTASGKKIGVLRIPLFYTKEYPALCMRAWRMLKASNKAIDVQALESAANDLWLMVLATHLKRMHAKGADAVLIDVAGNGGGTDLGEWAARLLTKAPVHSAPLLVTAGALADDYINIQLRGLRTVGAAPVGSDPGLRAALEKALVQYEKRKSAIGSRRCDMSWVWRERRTWQPGGCSQLVEVGFAGGAVPYFPAVHAHEVDYVSTIYGPALADAYRGAWSGPVYVITNNRSASASEQFVAIVRDNGIAKIIGEHTARLGCGNVNSPQLIVLPRSRLQFRAPDCVRLRADGSDEVAGIVPDIPVLSTPGESDRARAARMIALIEDDLKK